MTERDSPGRANPGPATAEQQDVRSREPVAAVLGVPIAALGFGFLQLSAHLQGWLFTDLPKGLGFDHPPAWWPIPMLLVGGLLVALVIRYLPGESGESPADGFRPAGWRPGHSPWSGTTRPPRPSRWSARPAASPRSARFSGRRCSARSC